MYSIGCHEIWHVKVCGTRPDQLTTKFNNLLTLQQTVLASNILYMHVCMH